MLGESTLRKIAARRGKDGNLPELYAWLFMRVSGAILMVIAVFHLLYMHFVIPGGVGQITYETVMNRWHDPQWGVFWRTYDVLLLFFALTHGSNGLRTVLHDTFTNQDQKLGATLILSIVYVVGLAMGAGIIFGL